MDPEMDHGEVPEGSAGQPVNQPDSTAYLLRVLHFDAIPHPKGDSADSQRQQNFRYAVASMTAERSRLAGRHLTPEEREAHARLAAETILKSKTLGDVSRGAGIAWALWMWNQPLGGSSGLGRLTQALRGRFGRGGADGGPQPHQQPPPPPPEGTGGVAGGHPLANRDLRPGIVGLGARLARASLRFLLVASAVRVSLAAFEAQRALRATIAEPALAQWRADVRRELERKALAQREGVGVGGGPRRPPWGGAFPRERRRADEGEAAGSEEPGEMPMDQRQQADEVAELRAKAEALQRRQQQSWPQADEQPRREGEYWRTAPQQEQQQQQPSRSLQRSWWQQQQPDVSRERDPVEELLEDTSDASPVATSARQTPSTATGPTTGTSGGSAWERIRARAQQERDRKSGGGDDYYNKQRRADHDGRRNGEFYGTEAEKADARARAQQEFDAMVERERRGGGSDALG